MRYLADTHLLIWFGLFPEKLSLSARVIFEDQRNELIFSTASIWEAAIKYNLRPKDFPKTPDNLRRELLQNQFEELPVLGEHALAMIGMPPIHKDPFDRMLIAQAMVEGITLLTSDTKIAQYPGPILVV